MYVPDDGHARRSGPDAEQVHLESVRVQHVRPPRAQQTTKTAQVDKHLRTGSQQVCVERAATELAAGGAARACVAQTSERWRERQHGGLNAERLRSRDEWAGFRNDEPQRPIRLSRA